MFSSFFLKRMWKKHLVVLLFLWNNSYGIIIKCMVALYVDHKDLCSIAVSVYLSQPIKQKEVGLTLTQLKKHSLVNYFNCFKKKKKQSPTYLNLNIKQIMNGNGFQVMMWYQLHCLQIIIIIFVLSWTVNMIWYHLWRLWYNVVSSDHEHVLLWGSWVLIHPF